MHRRERSESREHQERSLDQLENGDENDASIMVTHGHERKRVQASRHSRASREVDEARAGCQVERRMRTPLTNVDLAASSSTKTPSLCGGAAIRMFAEVLT
jgi:hypothetical protein